MKIIIVGYGRVGKQIVRLLAGKNHSIIVIDKDRRSIDKEPQQHGLRMIAGDAVDPDMLRQAEAENADVLLALTREENTNLMVAQTARIAFKIPKVIAMVYDPQRDCSFHTAGIDTLQITVSGAELLRAQIEGLGQLTAKDLISEMAKDSATLDNTAYPVPLRQFSSSGPYYVIIMGGGKVGYFLGRTLLEEGHEISIIEANQEIYGIVSHQLDCPVIFGDGTSHKTLEKAGASRCDLFVGVTNHDQDNLIGCQVARREFGIPKTIARVKNPKNEKIMRELGVNVTVSSTAIISSLIESELPLHKIRTLLDLRIGNLEIMEYALDGTSPVVGQQIRNLIMPPHCNIVTILRGGDAIIPRGDTLFQTSDVILALADRSDEGALRKLLLG